MATEEIGPAGDPAMSQLSNRLPFMSLPDVCKEQNFLYACVWRPRPGCGGKEVLKADLDASYFRESLDTEFKQSFADVAFQVSQNDGIIGKCFDAKSEVCETNLAATDPYRQSMAKKHNVKGAFAMWRDGAVYEFAKSVVLDGSPHEFVDSVGGSTGVAAATKAVQAVVRLSMAAKNKSK